MRWCRIGECAAARTLMVIGGVGLISAVRFALQWWCRIGEGTVARTLLVELLLLRQEINFCTGLRRRRYGTPTMILCKIYFT